MFVLQAVMVLALKTCCLSLSLKSEGLSCTWSKAFIVTEWIDSHKGEAGGITPSEGSAEARETWAYSGTGKGMDNLFLSNTLEVFGRWSSCSKITTGAVSEKIALSFLGNAVICSGSVVESVPICLLGRSYWEHIKYVRDSKEIWSCWLKSGLFLSLFSCCCFVSSGREINSSIDRGSE